MNSTVIPGKHHLSGPEVGQSHWLYCEKGPAGCIPPPAKKVQPAIGAAERLLLCSSITVWFGSATKTDIRRLHRQSGVLRGLSVPLCPASKNFTSRVRKRAKKVTLDPSPQLTLSLNGCPLASATKHQNSRHKNSFYPRPYPTWTHITTWRTSRNVVGNHCNREHLKMLALKVGSPMIQWITFSAN